MVLLETQQRYPNRLAHNVALFFCDSCWHFFPNSKDSLAELMSTVFLRVITVSKTLVSITAFCVSVNKLVVKRSYPVVGIHGPTSLNKIDREVTNCLPPFLLISQSYRRSSNQLSVRPAPLMAMRSSCLVSALIWYCTKVVDSKKPLSI